MNTQDRFQRIESLFREALRLAPEQREEFLDEACEDEEMRSELLSLLAEDAMTRGAIDAPVMEQGIDSFLKGTTNEPIPEYVGPYRVLSRLGEGGFGSVYLADQREPVQRQVAVKILKLGMDTRQVIARFEAERQALAMMEHPGIAKVFDAGATDTGRPYFVMELVRGVPVTEYCDERGLGTDDRIELFLQICNAVQHAHQKGVIHRDLKPSNVLVVEQDGKPIPKVIDFGIAKATNARLTEKTVFTENRQLIGTPEYMSPEQAGMGRLDIDTRSDIYSLGVLLYELLTGTTPFDVRSLRSAAFAELQRIIREVDPEKPSTRLSSLTQISEEHEGGLTLGEIAQRRRTDATTLRRQVRGDLDWIVMRAMEKDRNRRYASASALAADLNRHLKHEPVTAGPPSLSYRAAKFVRRNRVGVTAGAVMAAGLIIGSILAVNGMVRAKRQRDRAIEAQQQWQKRFDDVRHLANTFVFDVDELLEPVSGATPARELLVTTALEYLDSLAAEIDPGEDLQRELVDAYVKVGDIQGNPRRPNLGATEAALESFRKARGIIESVILANPNDPQIKLTGSRVYERLATIHQYLRDPEQSIADGERAVALSETALDEGAAVEVGAPSLAAAAGVVGDTYRQMGQLEPARGAYRRAYEISRDLAARSQDAQTRRQFSLACNDLGRVLMGLGDDDEALELFREALSIREQILAGDPDNVRAQRDTMISYHNVAAILSQQDLPDQALELLLKARTMASSLSEADPMNNRAAQDLGTCEEKVGDALTSLGRLDEALAAYERLVAGRRQLLALDEANTYVRIGLAIGIERTGDVLFTMDRLVEAETQFTEAHDVGAEATRGDPQNALNQTVAFMTSSKLGNINRRLAEQGMNNDERRQRLEAAIRWYQTAIEHRDDAEQHEVSLLANPEIDPAEAIVVCREQLSAIDSN